AVATRLLGAEDRVQKLFLGPLLLQPRLDLLRVAVADHLRLVADLPFGDSAVDVALDGDDLLAADLDHHTDVVDPADLLAAAPVEEDQRPYLRLLAEGVLLLEPPGVRGSPGELTDP